MFGETFDGTFFQQFEEGKFFFTSFFFSQVTSQFFQNNGTRIGNCIDGMTDTVNQAGLVISLFVQHAHEISIDFIHILPVANVLFQMMEHIDNLDIGTTVQRTFQRTDTGCNRRIGIRSGRTGYTDCKGRVITATVLSLQNKQQVKCTGIQFRKVFFQHMQEVFCKRKVFVRMADMQGTAVCTMTINIISIRYNGRETRDQFDRLAHQVVTGSIVRIRIERIHFQNTTGKDIHDILSFQVKDIHLGFLFQRHIIADQAFERG